MAARFLAKVQSSRARQRLPLRGSCHGAAVTEGVCVPVPPQSKPVGFARFPFLSPALTSSPGAGEVFPQGEAFKGKIDFRIFAKKACKSAVTAV